MALIVSGIILYLMSYFNVSLEKFKVLLEPIFYPVNSFENILSSFTMYILLQIFFISYVSLLIFSYLCSNDTNHNLSNETKIMVSCPECKYKCSSQ